MPKIKKKSMLMLENYNTIYTYCISGTNITVFSDLCGRFSRICQSCQQREKKKSENCGSPTEARYASRVTQLGVLEAL